MDRNVCIKCHYAQVEGGVKIVDALPTVTAGIALIPTTEGWSVTHMASGWAIGWMDSAAKARRFVEYLGTLGFDWTQDYEAVVTFGSTHRADIQEALRII